MRNKLRSVALLSLVLLPVATVPAVGGDRLFGRITTKDGSVHTGLVRWGANEASWYDVLDGSKRLPRSNREAAVRAGLLEEQRTREIRLLGFKLAEWNEGEAFPDTVQSGIRFGHIERLEWLDSGRARLILRSGEEVELESSVDLGSRIRTIVVEDAEHGSVDLEWKDVDVIEFSDGSGESPSRFGDRLYGTLLTRDGAGFKGFVCWDLDEMFTKDILDGEVGEETRKIEFGEIAVLERADSKSTLVTLKSGDRFRISGSNDVNDANRDILVLDPGLGQVRVEWDDFAKLLLEAPPTDLSFSFDGGHPLKGTVETEDGKTWTGIFRWDNDESYTWELLDGSLGDVAFDVEMGLVKALERVSMKSLAVTLTDGRSFELSGSNDVGEGNKGVFLTTDSGEEVAVPWADFRRLQLDHGVLAEKPGQ